MPIYIFRHAKTGKYREIFLSVNDQKVFNGDSGDEIGLWEREFINPYISTSSSLSRADPNDPAAFSRAVEGKKGTVGEMIEASAEMSARRAERNGGIDPVKKKAQEEYKEKVGKDSMSAKMDKGIENLKKMGVEYAPPKKKARK